MRKKHLIEELLFHNIDVDNWGWFCVVKSAANNISYSVMSNHVIKTHKQKFIIKPLIPNVFKVNIKVTQRCPLTSRAHSLDTEITAHKKRYIFPKERQQIIDELSLAPKKDLYF